jgi:DNA-binding PadR family transcriptional regulator
MKSSFLGEFEQMVLLAILQQVDNAYGVTIRSEIEARTGRSVARGAMYTTLDRLVTKGYLTSRVGEPTSERGGRAKRYFDVTPAGYEALRVSREALLSLWQGLESAIEKPR